MTTQQDKVRHAIKLGWTLRATPPVWSWVKPDGTVVPANELPELTEQPRQSRIIQFIRRLFS